MASLNLDVGRLSATDIARIYFSEPVEWFDMLYEALEQAGCDHFRSTPSYQESGILDSRLYLKARRTCIRIIPKPLKDALKKELRQVSAFAPHTAIHLGKAMDQVRTLEDDIRGLPAPLFTNATVALLKSESEWTPPYDSSDE